MIYEAFVSPLEQPNSLLELKRALITFDKIYISDPEDRDLFPPQAFMHAMGIPFPMAINMGSVRRLGKSPDYDDKFDALMSEIDVARREGLVDLLSSYERDATNTLTIGMVPMGNYPLNPQFMLWAYRNAARDQDVILSAIAGDNELLKRSNDELASITVASCRADAGINSDPALPLLSVDLAREDIRDNLSNIARARLATVIKTIGFCASKQMIPFFGSAQYSNVAESIAARANKVIDAASEHDSYWASRSQIMQIAHEEYIDEAVLNQMSIKDVLKLRTSAWGIQANAREEMLRSASTLSKELQDKSKFTDAVREHILKYRIKAEALERDRTNLSFKIKCDLAKITFRATSFLAGAGSIAAMVGQLTQIQSAIGAATTLLAGCMYTADGVKEHVPLRNQLRATEEEFEDDAAFGLHNFYSRIGEASKG